MNLFCPQVCLSSTKRVKTPKKSCTVPSPGVAALEPTAGLLPKSHSRHPLGEMQLSTSGHRNISKDGVSDGVLDGKGSDDKDSDCNGEESYSGFKAGMSQPEPYFQYSFSLNDFLELMDVD